MIHEKARIHAKVTRGDHPVDGLTIALLVWHVIGLPEESWFI